jgi:hypothetical protein
MQHPPFALDREGAAFVASAPAFGWPLPAQDPACSEIAVKRFIKKTSEGVVVSMAIY